MLDTYLDKLVGVCLSNGKQSIYVPLNHKSATYNDRLKDDIQMNPDKFKELFLKILENRTFKWIFHNAKFDLSVLRTFLGKPMPDPYWDTMLAAYLFNQEEEHSLKYQFNQYVATEDEGVNRFDTLFKGITFDYVPLDVATIYGGKDAYMTLELFEYQYKKMHEKENEGLLYVLQNIEMPLLPILEDMQRTGVNLNQSMLQEFKEKYEIRLAEAEEKVYQEIDKHKEEIEEYKMKHFNNKLDDPIKISSPSQLSTLFYDILGYKLKDGGRGTGVNELQELGTPLTLALLDYRKSAKLIDAFLVALPKQISDWDGKIHTSMNQYGAATRTLQFVISKSTTNTFQRRR